MSKRKPIDKTQARERRNRLLESAAAAELSLTDGVREMRAIAGMTQEEFAQHRGVSARVIKAIELGQGNPTVATLNRIGEFFGLEVAFVPVQRKLEPAQQPDAVRVEMRPPPRIDDLALAHKEEFAPMRPADIIRSIEETREEMWRRFSIAIATLDQAYPPSGSAPANTPATLPAKRTAAKKKPRSS